MTVHEAVAGPGSRGKLPPGQKRVEGFPRFGTDLRSPPPSVPSDPVITVGGAVPEAFDVPLAQLATLPRRELTADFHCVAGWSTTDLRWEGVPFAAFYRAVVEPALDPGVEITHVAFRGLDRFRSVLLIEDALAEGVLLADRLDGHPLDGDHGAPVRLLSPAQYGYMSTKHLCRIEALAGEPERGRWTVVGSWLLRSHPRARVAAEERHGLVPGRLVRPFYAALKGPLLRLSARAPRPRAAGREGRTAGTAGAPGRRAGR
ncbi:MAG TPA: molybdopterin-dependent oxidoreductase [Acidimicrobiales bacterium]|nr:molybdopterin-dependent oxidoreductase [Acidimicrobiales bacterium]